ncbi:LamB/YcsF family protein [Jatrophihabitans telluris]|uniref:5-oxoprolinase subunit A n=1 Tax=Jatrophihabitans telluris TaxID=2038343 RepID=A0ABY4R250_9ACTN|nr:5-oxoprolinase subunit PxpA [Jatrophihabitans telluris]UQX89612.1 LamB/YcsF family protein [Jatrophihabitans telluris]
MASSRIDLNADLGEGFGRWTLGDDEALLGVISSANIACGFHAGDPSIMRRTCELAVQRGVAIGAQVGYRDLAGFGRRRIDMAADELSADIVYQLGALQAFAAAAGGRVRYVKPHGALYNTAATDPVQAGAIAAAVASVDAGLPILTLPDSALAAAATAAGVRPVSEAFADRGYRSDGTLVPRSEPQALISDPDEVAARTLDLVQTGTVVSIEGVRIPIRPDSICVHGDSPHAVEIATAIRRVLAAAGIEVTAFS